MNDGPPLVAKSSWLPDGIPRDLVIRQVSCLDLHPEFLSRRLSPPLLIFFTLKHIIQHYIEGAAVNNINRQKTDSQVVCGIVSCAWKIVS